MTVLNTGKSRCVLPPFPGETPPTTFVPYAIVSLALVVACARRSVSEENMQLRGQLTYDFASEALIDDFCRWSNLEVRNGL